MPTVTANPLIGLEIHVQLATRSKMFCGCKVEFGAPPNSRVCAVCLGLPGALPVINRHAVELALRMALALNCRTARLTKWDRKSYYYPDLPKNYQISQYDLPLAEEGFFQFDAAHSDKRVRIRRAHLEEDAGKNLHEQADVTQVDLNRAGTPLLEIVTEPDLHSADEVYDFCTALQRLATYLEISEGVMQKGQMRFEPNINVLITEGGSTCATPICEVKNLNSFRAVRGAVEYEITRHIDTWKKDHSYTRDRQDRENRGWNEEKNMTVFQRGKEEAHDYRYFPDPDLVPLEISQEWLERIKGEMPELPAARQSRLVAKCGLPSKDAAQIVADRRTADLFDACIAAGAKPQMLGKHFISFWAKHANSRETTVAGLGIDAERIAGLARLVDEGTVSASAAATISEKMLDSAESPAAIARSAGLEQLQDTSAIEAMVEEAIAANPQAVEIIRSGGKKKDKSLGFLQGQVMQKSKGSANPKLVRRILVKKLGL